MSGTKGMVHYRVEVKQEAVRMELEELNSLGLFRTHSPPHRPYHRTNPPFDGLAGEPGLEPRSLHPECSVLPLHHSPRTPAILPPLSFLVGLLAVTVTAKDVLPCMGYFRAARRVLSSTSRKINSAFDTACRAMK